MSLDIDHIRERAEFLAVEILLIILTRALRDFSSTAAASLRTAFAEQAGKLAQVHPRGTSSAEGDLLAGELEEAWARLRSRVLGG